jgi:RNA-directed DNA polymerase
MEVSTKQLQIAELAATRPEESFTSLNHYLDMDWMKEAYRRTRRESAPGVDGQTMEEYGKELESNLQELIGLAKSGRYQAPPVRRVHIPKGDGKETRPIGIPTVVSYCTSFNGLWDRLHFNTAGVGNPSF